MRHLRLIFASLVMASGVANAQVFETCNALTSGKQDERSGTTCDLKIDGKPVRLSIPVSGPKIKLEMEGKIQSLELDVEPAEAIEIVQIGRIAKNYVLLYQAGDGEDSGSAAIAFATKDFKKAWKTRLAGFNLSSHRNGSDIYVSTIDFVAKLNGLNGKFRWKHSGLYQKRQFNGGGPITLQKNVVTFTDTEKIQVRVDDKSGKILK